VHVQRLLRNCCQARASHQGSNHWCRLRGSPAGGHPPTLLSGASLAAHEAAQLLLQCIGVGEGGIHLQLEAGERQ